MALEKAVQDISLLQANLSYVIKANDELRTELAVREKREQVRMKEMEKELSKRDREMDSLR
jgi:transcriptional regulator of NAD metabolism